ncbi:MAG: PhzF family phenazine biosynthesis protein [Acidobacteriota bacterium]|nr:PhzF family phenazine biosynthesis protein [Acidobacteriota bacterium]
MPQISITQVDAFSAQPFRGTPAAVCVLAVAADTSWMQSVALEMNLSETAFLVPEDGGYELRWFTPVMEVDLCGHATLASAHVLWEEGHLSSDAEAVFHTRSGLLRASRRGEWIELDFPALKPTAIDPPPALVEALGATPLFVGEAPHFFLVELGSVDAVRSLEPDLRALLQFEHNGPIVTAADTDGFDFVSRFFAPAAGLDEDPVTGSAHCVLCPYWAERLGKTEMTGFQASSRGGVVRVRLVGERVILGGQAVTTLRGELFA